MLRAFQTLRGCSLAASDGELGNVREFYFDDQSWTVRYLVVDTGAWLNRRRVLIAPSALREVDEQSGVIGVNLTQEQVRSSPDVDSAKPVSRQQEEALHQHYGWAPHWVVPGAVPGLWAPAPTAALKPEAFDDQGGPPAAGPRPEVSENLQPEVPPDSSEAQGDPHLRSSEELSRYWVHTAEDGIAGSVEDMVIDDKGWRIRYLVIDARQWLFGKSVLLAPEWIDRISFESKELFVHLPRSVIRDAPEYNPSAHISRSYEQRLHDHYGRKTYWEE